MKNKTIKTAATCVAIAQAKDAQLHAREQELMMKIRSLQTKLMAFKEMQEAFEQLRTEVLLSLQRQKKEEVMKKKIRRRCKRGRRI